VKTGGSGVEEYAALERTNQVYLQMNEVNNDWLPVEAEVHQSWLPKHEKTTNQQN